MFLRAISVIIIVGVYLLAAWTVADKIEFGFFTGGLFLLVSTFILLAIMKVMRDGLLGVDEDEDGEQKIQIKELNYLELKRGGAKVMSSAPYISYC